MVNKKQLGTLSCLIGILFSTNQVKAMDFVDMPNDWSRPAIEKAVEHGLLKGENNTIRPKENLTRSELATILNRVLGTEKKEDISSYEDISKEAWYYDEMAKAVAAGLFQGYNNKLDPEKPITREETFLVISRIFKLEEESDLSLQFEDANSIGDWSKSAINGLASKGYLKGDSGKIKPKENISRAEFASLISSMVDVVVDSSTDNFKNIKGNVVIKGPVERLENLKIDGDLILGEGVGNNIITLDNVKVSGRILMRAGKELELKSNSSIEKVLVDNKLVNMSNINVSKDSRINELETNSKIKILGTGSLEKLKANKGSEDSELQLEVKNIEKALGVDIEVKSKNKLEDDKNKEDIKKEEKDRPQKSSGGGGGGGGSSSSSSKPEKDKPEKINKTKLDRLKSKAKKLDKDLYTKDSLEDLENALDLVEKTQTQVDKKVRELERAFKQLEKRPVLPEEPTELTDEEKAKRVEDLISKIPENINLNSKKIVEKARDAFDELTDEQKKLVHSDKITNLTDALEIVEELESSKEEIKVELLDELKTLISELERLDIDANEFKELSIESSIIDIEDGIDKINELLADKQDEDQVIIIELDKYKKEIIDKIDEISSVEKLKQEIILILKGSEIEFRIEESKHDENVEYEVILSKESIERKFILSGELPDTEDERIAEEVEDKIANLLDIALESKKEVEKVRAAYDNLTSNQKKLVKNLEVLEKAESIIKELEEEKIEEERQAKIVKKALEEINLVESLEALENIKIERNLSETNETIIKDAIDAKRTDLEETQAIEEGIKEDYDNDKEIIDNQEQEVIDYYNNKFAKEVAEEIGSIPELDKLTLEDIATVESARKEYNSLTDEQKKLVENLGVLEASESKIKELEVEGNRQAEILEKTLEKIESVESLEALTSISIDLSLSDVNKSIIKDAIDAKRTDLEETQAIEEGIKEDYDNDKEIIDNQEQEVIDYYNNKFAKEVSDKIDSIPELDKLTLEDIAKVESARKEYNSLTDEQKKLVENIDVLEKVESIIKELEEKRQEKIVKKALEEINIVESLEALKNIKIERNLSETNKKTLVDAKNKKKVELELLKAKEDAISEVKIEYPESKYSKSKVEYNEAIEKVNEAKNLDEIDVKKIEAINLINKLYTDSEIEEIKKINEYLTSNMRATIEATNKQAKSKNFKVSYSYDSHKQIYEVGIDKSEESTSVLGTMRKGFATGLINPLTMGSKSGNVVNNIPENLISNRVTALDELGKYYIFDREYLLNLTRDTKAFEVFMPENQSASIMTKLKVLVGQSYSMQYKYKLSSGNEYTNSIVIKFTNGYK